MSKLSTSPAPSPSGLTTNLTIELRRLSGLQRRQRFAPLLWMLATGTLCYAFLDEQNSLTVRQEYWLWCQLGLAVAMTAIDWKLRDALADLALGKAERYEHVLALVLGLGGLSWTSSIFLFTSAGNPELLRLPILILMGLAVSAIFTYQFSPKITLAFGGATTALLISFAVAQYDGSSLILMGVALVIFGLMAAISISTVGAHRKQVENELLLNAAFQASSEMVMTVTPGGRLLRLNKAAKRFFGQEGTELARLGEVGALGVELGKILDLRRRELAKKKVLTEELSLTDSAGTESFFEVTFRAIDDALSLSLIFIRDVTAQVSRIRELQRISDEQAEKSRLESLSDLAHTVAQELTGPVREIRACAALASNEVEDGAAPQEIIGYLRDIDATANKIGRLIGALRAMTDESESDEEYTLDIILEDALALYRDRFSAQGIALEIADPENLLRSMVSVKRGQFGRALSGHLAGITHLLRAHSNRWVRIELSRRGKEIMLQLKNSFDPEFGVQTLYLSSTQRKLDETLTDIKVEDFDLGPVMPS